MGFSHREQSFLPIVRAGLRWGRINFTSNDRFLSDAALTLKSFPAGEPNITVILALRCRRHIGYFSCSGGRINDALVGKLNRVYMVKKSQFGPFFAP